MIDDTPAVKWSNAWWRRLALGLALPMALIVLALVCLANGHAYSLERSSGRGLRLVEVTGPTATLLIAAYAGLALAAFSRWYLATHPRGAAFADLGQGLGLVLLIAGVFGALSRTVAF